MGLREHESGAYDGEGRAGWTRGWARAIRPDPQGALSRSGRRRRCARAWAKADAVSGAEAVPAALARVALWLAELREARIEAALAQRAVAEALGVRPSSVAEWEGGRPPSWENFCAFGREIGMQLVVLGRDGCRLDGPADAVAGEPWARTELRRLAVALRAERVAVGLSRATVAADIGVSPWSFAHIERAQLSPRLIVFASWVGSVKSDIRWQPVV